MGLIKISELPLIQLSEIDDEDFVPVVDVPPLGTSRTKRMRVVDLFSKAPVKSVAGKTGEITLSSDDLSDGGSLGGIKSINGVNPDADDKVTLAVSDLNGTNLFVSRASLGNISGFTSEYNAPGTNDLTTEFNQLAKLLGQDMVNVRASLFQVKQTAENSISSEVQETFATKASLGSYLKTTDIQSSYYTKTDSDSRFVSDLSDYLTSTEISNDYATKAGVSLALAEFSSDTFDGTSVKSQTGSFSGDLDANRLSIQTSGTFLGALSSLRADVGDASSPSTDIGNNSTLVVHGNTQVNGKITANNLEVLGGVRVKSTQVVEVSDDFIEINKTDTDPTGTDSGIQVYRGVGLSKPELSWDGTASIWQVKLGTSLSGLRANTIEYANSYAETDLPTASNHGGMFAWDTTNSQAKVSTGSEWKTLVLSEEFGTLEEFESAFTTALGV